MPKQKPTLNQTDLRLLSHFFSDLFDEKIKPLQDKVDLINVEVQKIKPLQEKVDEIHNNMNMFTNNTDIRISINEKHILKLADKTNTKLPENPFKSTL